MSDVNDNDNDRDWAEALAGRERAGSDPATQLEARLLRQAQRHWPPASPSKLQMAADDDGVHERALIERARDLGLLRPRSRWCGGCAERWQRWTSSPWRVGAAGLVLASTLFAAMVVLPPVWRQAGEEPVLRAGTDGVLLLRDRDPRARRDRIADALEAAGVPVQRYERLGRWGIDADWPQPASAAASAALKAERVPAPSGSTLRIEVESAPP